MKLLELLLRDRTTKTNIIWATDAYQDRGGAYQRDKEIQVELITGDNSGVIKNRARKALEQQSERTRQHAEVFTPIWICQKMVSHADEIWFEGKDPFVANKDGTIEFPKKKSWKKYIDQRRLEITCGEAPYLVNRYDVATGEEIPIEKRQGILDRKLRVVNENAVDEKEWLIWALRSFQQTYGYEFQGDNLLIARLNLLMTYEEYLEARWNRKPTDKEYKELIKTITWNIWQMDGLTGSIPYCKAPEEFHQVSLFELFSDEEQEQVKQQPHSRIWDWRRDNSLEYLKINTGGRNMKFDFVIGNPPYQDETLGDNDTFAPPIYNNFMDEAYKVGEKVELIHPARFLFNAGSTPKPWNEKMLNDSHFRILEYVEQSKDVFAGTKIRGGICISYYDKTKTFESIKVYTPYPEMNEIIQKVLKSEGYSSLMSIMYIQNRFDLDALYEDYPEYKSVIGSKGKDKRFETGIFEKISLFSDVKVSDTDIKVYGVVKKKRLFKFFPLKYTEIKHENLDKYKVVIMKSNGEGIFGETLASIDILAPMEAFTRSFISIGVFETRIEAECCQKYLKSKFLRAMLDVKKVTQDNPIDTWVCVPIQDFTPSSDIDWSKSISEIDQQLYKKYNLDNNEINFIESHVKEMA